MHNLLANIRIVLVEPAGELNIGSIARIMKNMGLKRLILVAPQGNHLSDDARQMAVHAADVLENAQVVASLPEALLGCQRAIATTVRARSVPITLESPQVALPWLIAPEVESALIFGAEERGLSNDELKYAQRFVCIESSSEYPSLNLAQAVAVCVYQIYQGSLTNHHPIANVATSGASLEQLEGYYQDLEAILLDIGYLYPHTAGVKMEKFRRLYNRASLQPEEVAMLRGIVRQMRWAINNSRAASEE